MTEDDTFRKLSKPSFEEMRKLWTASDIIQADNIGPAARDFFQKYGWSYGEFINIAVDRFVTKVSGK